MCIGVPLQEKRFLSHHMERKEAEEHNHAKRKEAEAKRDIKQKEAEEK